MVVDDKNNPKGSIVKLNTNPVRREDFAFCEDYGCSSLCEEEESQAPAGLEVLLYPSQIGGDGNGVCRS